MVVMETSEEVTDREASFISYGSDKSEENKVFLDGFNKVLCGDRLTQMTKTYNDVEAVTRLLEEKERDLELAARIGQTLLEKNKVYEEKNETLEELLAQANERINQLKHDLSMKEELLKFYTQNYDNIESPETPEALCLSPGSAQMAQLQKKVKTLEEENFTLKLETSSLMSATDNLEQKEQKLVNDCVQQLEDLHQQLALFAKEISEKTEECASQREEITSLLSQIVALQKKVKTLTVENMDLQKTLEASQDSQKYLTRELAEVKEKNEELQEHLEETREELCHHRNKDRPQAIRHNYMSSSFLSLPGESLASELERSLGSEIDYPRGYSPMERRRHNWKIFETAKAAKKASKDRLSTSSLGVADSGSQSMLGIGEESGAELGSVSARSSMYFSDGDGESGVSDGYGGDLESLYGSNPKLGKPGIPGSNDLQSALRRLSLRRANELNEMDYRREERERQARERLESEASEKTDLDMSATPGRCRTPDSMFSAVSGYMSMGGSSNNSHYRMPEKLQIVKPLEGSATLRQWQQLATPHLGGIFECRPGVKIKGEQKLDLAPEVYTLSDYEEDDEVHSDYPSRFQQSPGVYTYTNSTVKHPSEATRLEGTLNDGDSDLTLTDVDDDDVLEDTTASQKSSTPKICSGFHGDRSGTTTYSMSQGLAAILNERDLLKSPPEGTVPKSFKVHSSNPPRFPSLVSDTHFSNIQTNASSNSETVTASASGTLTSPSTLTSRFPIPGSRSQTSVSSDIKTAVEGANSVMERLRNTGFTFYGFLSGAGQPMVTTRPNSLPVGLTGTVNMATGSANAVSTATGSSSANNMSAGSVSTVTMATGTISSINADSLVTIATSSESQGRSGLRSLFTHKTAGGVVGALANFKRNGIL